MMDKIVNRTCRQKYKNKNKNKNKRLKKIVCIIIY